MCVLNVPKIIGTHELAFGFPYEEQQEPNDLLFFLKIKFKVKVHYFVRYLTKIELQE